MQVEPGESSTACLTDRAERKRAHEGTIDHDTGHDRSDEQESHRAKEQRARQLGEQVHVESQHDMHESLPKWNVIEEPVGPGIVHQDG